MATHCSPDSLADLRMFMPRLVMHPFTRSLRRTGARGDGIQCMTSISSKSVERLMFKLEKQLQAYLRLANCPVGLLFNFNEVLLKNGLRRVVNRLPEASPRAPLPRILRVK